MTTSVLGSFSPAAPDDEPPDIRAQALPAQPASPPAPATSAGMLLSFAPDLDLRTLAARTRLPVATLAALDRGDTSRCGGDFYVRAHLTCVAAALDVPPETLLAAFHRRPAPHVDDTRSPAPVTVRAARRRSRRIAAWSGLAAVLIGGGAVAIAAADRSGTPGARPTPAARHGAGGGGHVVAKPVPVHRAPAPLPIPPGGVAVALATTGGPSWLSAQDATGRTLFEGLQPAGTVRVLTGSSVHLVIGDAGAVTLACNNHRLGSPGTAGQVVTTTYAPGTAGC
jgi:hypothetical protein